MSTDAPPAVETLPRSLLRDLRKVVGPEAVIDDPSRLLVYESDGLTAYRYRPAAVVLPGDGAEVRSVVGILSSAGVPFVPRGAGTGLSGGALASPGAVVVGTSRMNRILDLDPVNRTARLEPGVVNAHLTRACLPHGLHYVPDPSSQSACTIGGNVAENSGGPHCLKYGVTSRYVTGLRVVIPGGEEAHFGGLGRGGQGLDLVGLFVGSEGCFGIATEIEVRLLPLPRSVRTLLAIFDTLEAAGAAVSRILAEGLLPAALEIIDGETIRAVEASIFAAGYPTDAEAALVVEFDGVEGGLDAAVAAAVESCRAAGATEIRRARSEEERAALWKGRKKAFGAMGRIAPDLLVQDATVPRTRLPEVLRRIDEIGRRYDLTLANVFHAGDGNLHPNLLFDRRDPDELERVEKASREIMAVCVEAGGTITGEHGVGVDKRRYMPLVHAPAVLDAMRRVKEVFDPAGICNPGKVLPDATDVAGLTDEAGAIRDDRPADAREEGRTAARPTHDGADVLRPSGPSDVAEILRRTSGEGGSVRVTGRVTGRGDGADADRGSAGIHLSTERMDGIVEYEPGDLTLTAGAGLTLARLADLVGEEGQWLPTEIPPEGSGTLGGWVADGSPGFLATSFGGPRDLVLGLTLVSGDGRILRFGGRVVKNVAGFDLVRMVVGSRGGLGVVTEVTVRLFPRPPVDRTLLYSAEAARAASAAAGASLLPASTALLGGPAAPSVGGGSARAGDAQGPQDLPEAAPPGAPVTAIRILGSGPEVDESVEILASEIGAPAGAVEGPASKDLWRRAAYPTGARAPRLRTTLLPSRLPEALDLLGGSEGVDWAADFHGGRVAVWWRSPETPKGVEAFAARVEALGGGLQVSGVEAPADRGSDALVRGMRSSLPGGAAGHIAHRLHREFDPHGTLVPGGAESTRGRMP